MSTTSQELKEQRRKKKAEQMLKYSQTHQEERKLASQARSKAHTLETTARRIKGHSIDDLIKIAQLCCADRQVDYLARQNSIADVLKFLRGPEDVLNPTAFDRICRQTSASSSSDRDKVNNHDG